MAESRAIFRKNGMAFYAIDDEAREVCRAIKDQRDVMITVKTSRNPGQHRLFFAVLAKVCESGAWAYDVEGLLHWIKWRLGHVERMTVNGNTIARVKSISFDSMDQPEFQRFFERAVHVVCSEITGEGLRAEIIDMVDGPYKEALRAYGSAA